MPFMSNFPISYLSRISLHDFDLHLVSDSNSSRLTPLKPDDGRRTCIQIMWEKNMQHTIWIDHARPHDNVNSMRLLTLTIAQLWCIDTQPIRNLFHAIQIGFDFWQCLHKCGQLGQRNRFRLFFEPVDDHVCSFCTDKNSTLDMFERMLTVSDGDTMPSGLLNFMRKFHGEAILLLHTSTYLATSIPNERPIHHSSWLKCDSIVVMWLSNMPEHLRRRNVQRLSHCAHLVAASSSWRKQW